MNSSKKEASSPCKRSGSYQHPSSFSASMHDQLFFCSMVFIYSLAEIANSLVGIFVDPPSNGQSQIILPILTIIFFLVFDIIVFFYFNFRRKGLEKRACLFETILVIFLGCWILSRAIQSIEGLSDHPNTIKSEEDKVDYYMMSSDTLFLFILIISFIQQIYNIIIYIVLMLSGHILMLFFNQEWIIGTKTIIEGALFIALYSYMQRKKMKFLNEAWKLKIFDAFYKNVLNLLPEGVMVLTANQDITYINHYLEHTLAWDNLSTFSSNFQSLKLRDFIKESRFKQYLFPIVNSCSRAKKASLHDLSVEDNDGFRISTAANTKEGLLKAKAGSVSSFLDLVRFFQQNSDTWAKISTHTLVFDSKYTHPLSKETLSIEIKAFILIGEKDIQLTLLFRDTTDRDKIATLEAETESYKNNLIASFSHELRTPLNSNLGSLEQSMKHPKIPQDIKDTLLEPALVSAKLLLHLVNDTLDYSQALNRSLQINIKRLPINQTLKECVSLFEKRILAKGLTFELFIDQVFTDNSNQPSFWTDHQRVSQILTNLLSNALKFTFEGMIQVKFLKTEGGYYKLSVFDTGTGMSPEVQERLRKHLIMDTVFESKVSSDTAGIGLGLRMTSTLCDLLSPKEKQGLNFTSRKDEGSEFYVYLKDFAPISTETDISQLMSRKESESQNMLPILSEGSESDIIINTETSIPYQTTTFKNRLTESQKEPPLSLSPRASRNPVMVVDDEIFNILILENYCKSLELKPQRAFNGKDCIEKIKKIYAEGQKVELVLTDVNMPIMDGYETTRTLRGMVKNKEIDDLVIIGITAYVSRDKIDKCFESGMNEVVNKPISHEDFMKLMKKYNFH